MEHDQHNPYAPPATDAPAPPAAPAHVPRSVVPRIFGILSIIFSSLTMLVMLVGMLSAAVYSRREGRLPAEEPSPAARAPKAQRTEAPEATDQPSADTSTPQKMPTRAKRTSKGQDALAGILGLSFITLTPALLVIGIGQVRYRRWAAKATLVWSALALASIALMIGIGALNSSKALLGTIPVIVFYGPYPILLLVFFGRRRTLASMQGAG